MIKAKKSLKWISPYYTSIFMVTFCALLNDFLTTNERSSLEIEKSIDLNQIKEDKEKIEKNFIPSPFSNTDSVPCSKEIEKPSLKNQFETRDLPVPSANSNDMPTSVPYIQDNNENIHHPNLKLMEFEDSLLGRNVSTWVYVKPDVSEFYNENSKRKVQEQVPNFQGLAGKFINMSPFNLNLYYHPGENQKGILTAKVEPFNSVGSGTFPGHIFYFARDDGTIVCHFEVVSENSLYVYDPFYFYNSAMIHDNSAPLDLDSLKPSERANYDKNAMNLKFASQYKKFTNGAEWLSMYPRDLPKMKMWRADHFDQEYAIISKETRFVSLPPSAFKRVDWINSEMKNLSQYREDAKDVKLKLKVISCAPQIFEIDNFLSDVEVEHILSLSEGSLARSTTGTGADGQKSSTRTSLNTWVDREASPIVDVIYRRVAEVLGMNESLLRHREPHESPEIESRHSLAEPIQLIHYDVGQQYTAHHDFGYPSIKHKNYPSRHANMLMYLNDVEEGGETSFPRWRNGYTTGGINVKPKKGKAVLFYSLLPDGNMDDLSQHAALPVTKGEKWLANLWIWDPIRT